MSSILNILPALAFLLILLSISAYIQRTSKENRQKDFAITNGDLGRYPKNPQVFSKKT